MKMKKAIALGLAIMILVAVSVAGTVAWLMDDTPEVKNTFTAGKVEITLKETELTFNDDGSVTLGEKKENVENNYPAIPGTEYLKDPTVTVVGGSEECYLFVKFEENGNPATYYTYTSLLKDPDWTKLEGKTNVWYRVVPESATDTSYGLLDGNKITVKDSVTNANMNEAADAELIWTAYAVQKANVADAAAAWAIITG